MSSTPTSTSTDVGTPVVPYGKAIKKNIVLESLSNPGKFDLNHQATQNITQLYYFQGARVTGAAVMFDQPRDTHPDKQLIFIPALEANHEGSAGTLQVRSMLGDRHHFEGVMDTAFNSNGRYKYSNGRFHIKPGFAYQGGQNVFHIDVDYKGSSYTSQASASSHGEFSISHNQSITPKLTAGVQLLTVTPFATFFNWTTKYTGKRNDIMAVSYKNGKLTTSYSRRIFDQFIPQIGSIHSTLATEVSLAVDPQRPFKSSIKQSEWICGLQHIRPTTKYTATVASDWSVGAQAEYQIQPAVNFLFSGEMKYDGSNAGKFGVGLTVG